MRNASVHRFHDKVAVSLPTGATCYLNEKEARMLSKALLSCAQSVKRESFVGSNFGTASIELENDGKR